MNLQSNFLSYNKSLLILLLFKNFIKEIKIINNELTFSLSKIQYLPFVLNFLKNHYKFQFKELVHLSVVDYYLQSSQYRFELNYILLSIKYKSRIRVKVYCEHNTVVPSVTNIYTSALWLERENWDMFGIYFLKHPDLRRILTDYGFAGYPFRKDFPLSGYVELRYDSEKKTVVYDLLELTQEYRFFEFTKPWAWNISITK